MSVTRCCPVAQTLAPKRKRRRRIPLTGEHTFVVFTAMVSHLAFVACSVAAEAATCFVSNSIANAGRHCDESASKVTTTRDKLYSASRADGKSLRCRPISSTISPHLLHVPPPMRSTKDNASLYESSLKKIRNRRKGGSKNKSKELARRQQPSAARCVSASGPTRLLTNLSEGSKEMRVARSDRSQEGYAALSTSELQSLTNKFLATGRKSREMNASDLNDATRLLSSWGERKAKESGDMAEKIFNRILDKKTGSNKMSVPSVAMVHTVSPTQWVSCHCRVL